MPASMTGFGRGSVTHKGQRFVVEARSVNSRFCEVRVQAPRDLLEAEHRLSAVVRQSFSRGKFELILRTESAGAGDTGLDEEATIRRYRQLERLAKKLGMKGEVPLESALRFSGAENGKSLPADALPVFEKATGQALAKLKASREKEGAQIVKDMKARGQILRRATEKIERLVPPAIRRRQDAIRTRLLELIADTHLNEGRIEMEAALLADRADVTEELVRLKTHLLELARLLSSSEAVGRTLDFLIQEIHREINTIGSKTTDQEITALVVTMKSELEKIREQAQNIE